VRLAVILPMYDEAENVAPLLARLAAVRVRSGLDLIAIAVNDGSRDATADRLRQMRTEHPFLRQVAHPRNRGLAAALRTGIATALAERQPPVEAIACMDADLTHAPEDLPRLLEPLEHDRADFVLGSRYVPGGGMRDVPLARRAISVFGNRVGQRLLGVGAADLTSGYRVARAEVYRAIRLDEPGFGIQLEGTVKAQRAGFRVAEVPITLGVRRKGYSKMAYTRAFWIGYLKLFVRLVLGLDAPRGAASRLRVVKPPRG
jgi:dolichol-phosphate mannosyltransferase